MTDQAYEFTNDWFNAIPKPVWETLIPQLQPKRILEIGSYEGASSTYLVEKLSPLHAIEMHCVDTWSGGIEHAGTNMNAVEARFDANMAEAQRISPGKVTLHKHKGYSDQILPELLVQGFSNYFDFIYIDGSHQAPDVLLDAVFSFKLLKVGGVIAFDDYLWSEQLPGGVDPIRCPKPAIDAFTNIYCRKLNLIQAPLYQLYIQKTAD